MSERPLIDTIGGTAGKDQLVRIRDLADTGIRSGDESIMRASLGQVEHGISGLPRAEILTLTRQEIVWALEGEGKIGKVLRVVNNVRGKTSELMRPLPALRKADLMRLLQSYRDTLTEIIEKVEAQPVIPLVPGETRAEGKHSDKLVENVFDGYLRKGSVLGQVLKAKVASYHPTEQELLNITTIITQAANQPRATVMGHINPTGAPSRTAADLKGLIATENGKVKTAQDVIKAKEREITLLREISTPKPPTTAGGAWSPAPDKTTEIQAAMGAITTEEGKIRTAEGLIQEMEEAVTYLENGGDKVNRFTSESELAIAVITQLESNRGNTVTPRQVLAELKQSTREIESPIESNKNRRQVTLQQYFDIAGEAWFGGNPVIKKLGKERINDLLNSGKNEAAVRMWVSQLEANDQFKGQINEILAMLACMIAVIRQKGINHYSAAKAEQLENNLRDILEQRIKEKAEDDPTGTKAFDQFRELMDRNMPLARENHPKAADFRKAGRTIGKAAKWAAIKGKDAGLWTLKKGKDGVVYAAKKGWEHREEIGKGFETSAKITVGATRRACWALIAGMSGGFAPIVSKTARRGLFGKGKSAASKSKLKDIAAKAPKVKKKKAPKKIETPAANTNPKETTTGGGEEIAA